MRLNDRSENELVKGEDDENPRVILDVTINCTSADEIPQQSAKGKGKKKKRKWDHFWSKNLTVFALRSDGKLVTNRTIA